MAELIDALREFGPLELIFLAVVYILTRRNVTIKLGDKNDDN